MAVVAWPHGRGPWIGFNQTPLKAAAGPDSTVGALGSPGGRAATLLGLRRREQLNLLNLCAFPETDDRLPWNFDSPGDLEFGATSCL